MFAPRSVLRRDRKGHQRVALALLDDQERDQQDHGPGDLEQRRRRSPPHVDGVDNRVDEQREARGDGHSAGQVKRGRSVLGTALEQRARSEGGGDEPDRDVDEQHPTPAQAAGENPAEEHASCGAGARDRTPDPQRPVALGTLGERGGDDRQRCRGDDCRAEPLQCPRDDQPPLRLSNPTGERSDREQHQAEHEHAPASEQVGVATAEQVGEATAEQQEAAEGERVCVHDPREVGAGEVEVRTNRGQRDVHDRRVDHHHELRHRQQQQREALGAGCI